MCRMAQHSMVYGLPPLDQVEQVYGTCLAGKQRRVPFTDQACRRSKHAINLVHGDIYRPISPTTPSGNEYFVFLVDDMSHFMWLVLLPNKSQAASEIMNFTSVKFGCYYTEHGIQRQLTAAYSPQQNGVVEGTMKEIMVMSRCMVKAKQLPDYFWGRRSPLPYTC